MRYPLVHLAAAIGLLGGVPADSTRRILVGAEYVLIDNPGRTGTMARELQPIGFTAMKHYPEHAEWGAMQSGPGAPIDFRRLDAFVREFQASGVAELVLCLRSASRWGSVHAPKIRPTNIVPKPQYLELYRKWIGAVVERYDGDGQADLPGLRRPVRYYEIGSEFSSYEPEPVEEYLAMLEVAYRAAHAAYDGVLVAHAAFLTTTAFTGHPGPAGYERGFAAMPPRIAEHSLADMRKILDHPEHFDLVNLHALGDPAEIEDMSAWVEWEMSRRGYRKPVIISDTATNPFIAWGRATACKGPPATLGIIVAPATEADRCRLAAYFTRLVDGDRATVEWTQGFAGVDNVKKVVIAAERGIILINTAFTEDLVWFKLKLLGAGTGPSAWAGLVDLGAKQRRAGYYALLQLMQHLKDYDEIKRVATPDPALRVYEIRSGAARRWIAWLEPPRPVLPGDPVPSRQATIVTGGSQATMEPLIVRAGVARAVRQPVAAPGGVATVALTPDPVFILPLP